jgi:hypothetical protein
MTDKPIIFSGPMVRALTEGRKTQTRRVLKPQPHEDRFWGPEPYHPVRIDRRGEEYPGPAVFGIYGEEWGQRMPYAPGDRLWVREAWRVEACFDDRAPRDLPIGDIVSRQYEADGVRKFWRYTHLPVGRCRHARFMPRWASRLTLTVTEVRVQRVQDISYSDTLAEGIEVTEIWQRRQRACIERNEECGSVSRDSFRDLWNSLHGPDAWDRNDWVAALTFTVERRNIDEARP